MTSRLRGRGVAVSTPRFAVFAPNMAGGGAERAALQLATGLNNRGYRTDLVLARAVGPRMVEVPRGVRVVDLGARRVLTSLPALTGYLRRARPQAMASFLDHANVAALWARRLVGHPKRLVVVEQNHLTTAAKHGKSRRDRIMPMLARRFYPWADGVVGVSAGVVADLRAQLDTVAEGRYRVIYNPIVTDEMLSKAKLPVQHPWFAQGDPVFVAAGRLRPQKDFPTLIRAFAQVRSTRPARLLILGDGPERHRIQALIEDLRVQDDIQLLGYTANPYSFFARASAFVLSSRWEGLPTVLVEALACGAPAIASDCPSGPREILADGRYGRLVPVEDVRTLASALDAALDGTLPRPPEESWRPYLLDAVIDDYLEILTTES